MNFVPLVIAQNKPSRHIPSTMSPQEEELDLRLPPAYQPRQTVDQNVVLPIPPARNSNNTRANTAPPAPPAGSSKRGFIFIIVWIAYIASLTWYVDHKIRTAIDNDTRLLQHAEYPDFWARKARVEVYSPCYIHLSPTFTPLSSTDTAAVNACRRTANVEVVSSLVPYGCDAIKLQQAWNLITSTSSRNDRMVTEDEVKYPEPCLEAVGEELQKEALKEIKQNYRKEYWALIWIFLSSPFAAALAVGIVHVLGKCCNCCVGRMEKKKKEVLGSRPGDGPEWYQMQPV